jgi:GTP cyclohydrolase I
MNLGPGKSPFTENIRNVSPELRIQGIKRKDLEINTCFDQRSHITIGIRCNEPVGITELIRIAENEASCELYGLLKRSDEKFVTERAYDNPKFVEDMVRDVALRLDAEPRIGAYVVESENFESIHNHSAYALIERDKHKSG